MMRVTKSLRTAAGYATVFFLLSPVLARAEAIEEQLDCKSSGHTFISALLASGEIQNKPMRVEANSVNAFRPAHGVKLTAYDYKVFVVLGYQKDDPIFAQGKGTPIADSAYGVVVTGPTDDVKDRVHQSGSSAIVHEITPVTTAILCKSQ
ncbi:hypothetical protein [Burkholderia sp. Leaf177]|uniref:hypothetical protein n=1 Tax=Burkholderia sp. Leaf177 TaxID=1736287 RepID=UPI000A843129|nr:hypothetical protein [Burkholderia sp. Leaf177]